MVRNKKSTKRIVWYGISPYRKINACMFMRFLVMKKKSIYGETLGDPSD